MTEDFIKETAHAWHIDQKKVAELADWTNRKVNPDYQAVVFTKLLRQHMGTHDDSIRKDRGRNGKAIK